MNDFCWTGMSLASDGSTEWVKKCVRLLSQGHHGRICTNARHVTLT
jgi:hypothetical protein